MRYRFIDRVVSLEPGPAARIEVLKTFDPLDDAFTGPHGPDRMPSSLLVELLAMTGGRLLFHQLGQSRLPLLVKVTDFRVDHAAHAGAPLSARAEVRGVSGSGEPRIAETTADAHQEGTRIASGRFLYLCVEVPGADLVAAGAP